MSSQRRIRASRANGAHSHGPQTPQAKKTSSQNAIRHGLLANIVVLSTESCEGFEEVLADFYARLGPVDGLEFGMIEEMAAAHWRQRRAWSIEQSLLSTAIDAQPPGPASARLAAAFRSLAAAPEIALLHRYESRLHHMFHRSLNNLIALRSLETPPEAPNDRQ